MWLDLANLCVWLPDLATSFFPTFVFVCIESHHFHFLSKRKENVGDDIWNSWPFFWRKDLTVSWKWMKCKKSPNLSDLHFFAFGEIDLRNKFELLPASPQIYNKHKKEGKNNQKNIWNNSRKERRFSKIRELWRVHGPESKNGSVHKQISWISKYLCVFFLFVWRIPYFTLLRSWKVVERQMKTKYWCFHYTKKTFTLYRKRVRKRASCDLLERERETQTPQVKKYFARKERKTKANRVIAWVFATEPVSYFQIYSSPQVPISFFLFYMEE